jgi:hypothetical protein
VRALEVIHLGADLLLLLWATERLAILAPRPQAPSARFVSSTLIAVSLLAGWGLVLGYLGQLRPALMSLGIACTGAIATAGAHCRGVGVAMGSTRCLTRLKVCWDRSDLSTKGAFIGAGAVLVACALFLTGSPTIIHDDLTYRLPRIAIWDGTHSIRHFSTGEPRMNYMPVVPDLIQWWVLAHFSTGYSGAGVISLVGSVLVLGSMLSGGRLLKIGAKWSIVAWLFWLLLPPVFPQLSTAQTDVWTAGLCASGIYFLCRMWRTRRFSPWAPLALALAFASKGTVYYLIPGLLGFVLVLHLFRRFPVVLMARGFAAFAVMFLAFAGPRHLENLETYGNVFGPPEMIQLHARGVDKRVGIEVFGANATAFAIQNLDPNVNPRFMRTATKHVASASVSNLLADEPAAGVAFVPGRTRALLATFALPSADGDTSSFGILFAMLSVIAGMLFGWRFGQLTHVEKALGISAGLLFIGWWCVMCVLGWHPYAYRYSVIVLTPVCLGIAAAIASAPQVPRYAAVVAILAWQGSWAIPAVLAGNQWGPSLKNGIGQSMLAYLDLQKGRIAAHASGRRLGVACEYQMISAGFLRTGFPSSETIIDPNRIPKTGSLGAILDELGVDVLVLSAERIEGNLTGEGVHISQVDVTNIRGLSFRVAATTSQTPD